MSGEAVPLVDPLPAHIRRLHLELGIPDNYGPSRGIFFQPETFEADLVVATSPDAATPIRLLAPAASAWGQLAAAALRDGVILHLVSGFRNVERQATLIRRKLSAGASIDDVLKVLAAPGFSEHHTGRAADVNVPGNPPLEVGFEKTDAFAWLSVHASAHGFRLSYPRSGSGGIGYEPWHWYWSP